MTGPRIGGLFAGYGGLEMGVQSALGGDLAWYSEIDKGALKILTHRHPDVPNVGDVTTVKWTPDCPTCGDPLALYNRDVPEGRGYYCPRDGWFDLDIRFADPDAARIPDPVEILTGGSPCQDLSHAGKRAGMTDGTRSNLWVAMREAIAQLRPGLVVWENVRGAYSAEADSGLEFCAGCMGDAWYRGAALRALGRVLGDLSDLGYDAGWHGLRAADVGAPHGRMRVFVVAYPRGIRWGAGWPTVAREAPGGWASADLAGRGDAPLTLLGTPTARDHKGSGQGDRLRKSARRGQVEGQVLLIGKDRGALVEDGDDAGGVLPLVDREESAEILGGFGAEGDGHNDTLAPFSTADLAPGGKDFTLLPTPAVNDMGAAYTPDEWDAWTDRMKTEHGNGNGNGKSLHIEAARLLQTPSVADGTGGHETRGGARSDEPLLNGQAKATDGGQWGDYADAIARWEHTTRRPAPAPTMTSTKGNPQLAPAFVEWMMGLPAGWVTDTPGITRNEALKALGNGVVPQQAEAALRFLLSAASVGVVAS